METENNNIIIEFSCEETKLLQVRGESFLRTGLFPNDIQIMHGKSI